MLVLLVEKERNMRTIFLFFRSKSIKKTLLLPLLFNLCVTISLVLLIFSGPSCSNTSDASEDAIEDSMHDDIQAEDVETEPGGGTWTDPISGLTWQNPSTESEMPWQEAMDYCEALTLGGHSDWRLPTISEMRSFIRSCPATQTGGSCGVDDGCLSYSSCWSDPCSGCSYEEGPDDGCYWPVEVEGPCSWYWSSSSREDNANYAWNVFFYSGYVSGSSKDNDGGGVRCVR